MKLVKKRQAVMMSFFLITMFSLQLSSVYHTANAVSSVTKYDFPPKPNQTIIIYFSTENGTEKLSIPMNELLFTAIPRYDKDGNTHWASLKLNPDLNQVYKQIGFPTQSQKVAYVYPVFTQAAYGSNGFYDYYRKNCDTSCLTVPMPTKIEGRYSSSILAAYALTFLNYSNITDMDIDKNPAMLKKYDKVIILHNEYVTQREFDAITKHPNVVYLFPNALYAKVATDYQKGTITLIRGHGYPDKTISNGFNWKNDNSRYEYNYKCDNWNLYKVSNGKMMNCYPEYKILYDKSLLLSLKN